jgi:hypothetical protein
MKNGLDRKNGEEPEDKSNVVSFKDARVRAAVKARERARKGGSASDGPDGGKPHVTLGQWIVGGLFMLMAIGGAIALVRPFVKGVGISGGLGIG